jgi:hypothetical protein
MRFGNPPVRCADIAKEIHCSKGETLKTRNSYKDMFRLLALQGRLKRCRTSTAYLFHTIRIFDT